MPVETLLLATRSGGKLHELGPLIEAAGFRAASLDGCGIAPSSEEESIEAFGTFEENARAKANYFRARATGYPDIAVLADDSGLAVDALGGAPGVRSKRWAMHTPHASEGLTLDEANNRALLDALAGATDRRAKYVCVAAIAWEGGDVRARGECTGRVLLRARGAGGFGYDPLFLSDELGVTFAEATREEKARVSHRARAVRAVLAQFALRASR